VGEHRPEVDGPDGGRRRLDGGSPPVILEAVIRAVVFDLDGVLLDSEHLWDEARREVVAAQHGRWRRDATAAMQGMSSVEWSAYLHDELAVDVPPERIADLVVERILNRYRRDLPLLPGAVEAVRRVGERWPLGLASSSNREVIDAVVALTGLEGRFRATVSSEEVPRGKPAPDVYLEAVRRIGEPPRSCVAVEDSANGIRSAAAAGLATVAVPDPRYPAPAAVLSRARLVIRSLADLTVESLEDLARVDDGRRERRLDEQELESFPASDSHADWAGPPG